MHYVQFYQPSAIEPNNTIEACGDRSVVILDGRMSAANMASIANYECQKRKFQAWRVFRGRSFSDSVAVSQLHYLSTGEEDRTASAATHGA